MKLARRQNHIIKGGIATALLLCVFFGASRYAHSLIAQAPVTVIHDLSIADAYQKQLTNDLVTAIHAKGPAHVVQQPTHYSPILSALNLRYTYPYHGLLTYHTIEPAAHLNQRVVALATGDLVPQDMLNPDTVATLPEIQVPNLLLNESQTPVILTLFLQNLKPFVAQHFACEWRDPDTCYYRDLQNTRYTIVADGHKPITEDDIKLYEAVLEQFRPKSARQYAFDIRFKGQVVVTPDGGV